MSTIFTSKHVCFYFLCIFNAQLFSFQNIRNNKNHARTPKWAQRYGLVDTSAIERKQRRSQWAARYNERLSASALEGQPYEEGQERGSSIDLPAVEGRGSSRSQKQQNRDLWRPEDESYYSAETGNSSGRWRYPANFEDAALPSASKRGKKKKKEKKDRWARTEDAYSLSEERSHRRKSRKKKSENGDPTAVGDGSHSTIELPEDPEGGSYHGRLDNANELRNDGKTANELRNDGKTTDEVLFDHQF